jgi:hypothetical protein
MKTVRISGRAKALMALLRQARRGGLILQSPEGREYVLAEIDGFGDEVERTSKIKRLMTLLEERGNEEGALELEEAKKQLGLE